MILFRLLGLVFLAAAFLAAAFEIAARGMGGGSAGLLSAWQVWFVHAPETLLKARLFTETLFGIAAWESIVAPVLTLPGWLILGVPGGLFMWLAGRRPTNATEQGGDAMEEESLYLYDALTRAANDEGHTEQETDLYTDSAADIHGSWKDEDDHDVHPAPDARDAQSPHRPPPGKISH